MTLLDERLRLANEVADVLVGRFGDVIRAVGLHGSMAHGDIDEYSDVDLLVVVNERGSVPERSAWIDGVYVSISVNTPEFVLADAREVGSMWAAAADQYVNTRVLYDPTGFFDLVRTKHEEASRDVGPFVAEAKGILFDALEVLAKARRYVDRDAAPAAQICLGEGLVAMALAVGLLTRTRWRGTHHAVAGAAEVGGSVAGFSDAYVRALDVTCGLDERVSDAQRAADALRRHLESLGEVFEVASVTELFAID